MMEQLSGHTVNLSEMAARVMTLEAEIKDLRELTSAVVRTAEQVEHLKGDIYEIKKDVKTIGGRSGQWWDKFMGAVIGAVAAAMCTWLLR